MFSSWEPQPQTWRLYKRHRLNGNFEDHKPDTLLTKAEPWDPEYISRGSETRVNPRQVPTGNPLDFEPSIRTQPLLHDLKSKGSDSSYWWPTVELKLKTKHVIFYLVVPSVCWYTVSTAQLGLMLPSTAPENMHTSIITTPFIIFAAVKCLFALVMSGEKIHKWLSNYNCCVISWQTQNNDQVD